MIPHSLSLSGLPITIKLIQDTVESLLIIHLFCCFFYIYLASKGISWHAFSPENALFIIKVQTLY